MWPFSNISQLGHDTMVLGNSNQSQFHEPVDPTRDNLSMIVTIGYASLNSTAKWTFNLIYDLTRMGVTSLKAKRLTDIQNHSSKTTFNALNDLEQVGLISRNSKGVITVHEPNARNKDFRKVIASL